MKKKHFSMQDDMCCTKVEMVQKTSVVIVDAIHPPPTRQRTITQNKETSCSPTICGSEQPSRSSSTVPVCRHVRSSNRLCRESVETWGLLHLSPPSSTFSSNFTHLQICSHTHKVEVKQRKKELQVSDVDVVQAQMLFILR